MDTVRDFYEELKGVHVVQSLSDFSRLCGRRQSWASSFISRNFDMPTDAMTAMYCNLLEIRDSALNAGCYEVAGSYEPVLNRLWYQICQRVRERRLELE